MVDVVQKIVVFGSRKGFMLKQHARQISLSYSPLKSTESHIEDQTSPQRETKFASLFKEAINRQDEKPFIPRSLFRTTESNPVNHTEKQLGLFYRLLQEDVNRLFSKGVGTEFLKQVKTFQEACIMVRPPALRILKDLNEADFSKPPAKHVIYGRDGCGKTLTLAHVMHYCALQQWLLLYVPWPKNWSMYAKEVSLSSFTAGRYDLPLEGVTWLQLFLHMNKVLLNELKLKSSRKYTWTKREHHDEGTPLLEILEYGINRAKFASDVMGVLLREIRAQSSQNRFKALLAIEGINALWGQTKLRSDTKQLIPPENISLFHHIKKMLNNDWNSGAILVTADIKVCEPDNRYSHSLEYFLGKQGCEMLDPFVPVVVENYSDKEIHSCMEYYLDRMWITNKNAQNETGRKELIFLSAKNPYELMKVAGSW